MKGLQRYNGTSSAANSSGAAGFVSRKSLGVEDQVGLTRLSVSWPMVAAVTAADCRMASGLPSKKCSLEVAGSSRKAAPMKTQPTGCPSWGSGPATPVIETTRSQSSRRRAPDRHGLGCPMRNHRAFRNTQQVLLDLGLIGDDGAGEGVAGARLASEEMRESSAGNRLGGSQRHSRLLGEFDESLKGLVHVRQVRHPPVPAMDTQRTDQ